MKDEKDDKEKEEEIQKLINEAENGNLSNDEMLEFVQEISKNYKLIKKSRGRINVMLGFLVNQNIFIHFLLTLVMNILIGMAVNGFLNIISYSNIGILILSLSLFSVFEMIIKIVILKLFMRMAIYTMGVCFAAIHFTGFILLDIFMPGFEFKNTLFYFLFIFIFNALRMVLSRYVRMYSLSYQKGE